MAVMVPEMTHLIRKELELMGAAITLDAASTASPVAITPVPPVPSLSRRVQSPACFPVVVTWAKCRKSHQVVPASDDHCKYTSSVGVVPETVVAFSMN